MARYFIHFSGRERDSVGGEFHSSDDARNHAVAELGALLAREPEYASIGHWKVDVEDDLRRPVVHVMVATITPRRLRLDEPGEE